MMLVWAIVGLLITSDKSAQNVLQKAEAHFYEGRLDISVKLLDSCLLKIDRTDKLTHARLLIKRGKMYAFQSFTSNVGYEEALASLFEARELLDSTRDFRDEAEMHIWIGFTYYAMRFNRGEGDYDRPADYFQKALVLSRQIGDARSEAEAIFYSGIIHERRQSADPMPFYRQAETLARKHGFKLELSYATRHIAFLMQKEKKLDEALALFNESLKLREEIGFKIYLPFSYMSVGDVLVEMNRAQEALDYFDKAHRLADQLGSKRVVALSLLSLGDAHKTLKDRTRARQYFTEAKELSKAIQYKTGVDYAEKNLKELDTK
ncbi:tetratricopeptide repeat protein [bacterium]|nr:tetratricopeptide repeat protein [bacterium]